MRKNTLRKISEDHIRRTAEAGFVFETKTYVCKLTQQTIRALSCRAGKVFVSTRALKHIYDKRTAWEFDFFVDNFPLILQEPDFLYKNKQDKRGNYCFVKIIDTHFYMISVEIVEVDSVEELQIATAFRLRDDRYLKNYDLLWSRRDGGIRSS